MVLVVVALTRLQDGEEDEREGKVKEKQNQSNIGEEERRVRGGGK